MRVLKRSVLVHFYDNSRCFFEGWGRLSKINNKETRSAKTLKRSDITKIVQKEIGLPKDEASDLVGQVFAQISDALTRGEHIKLAGFGTFNLRQKSARLGRNPKTGKACMISPRTVVTFKPSSMMRERVQSSLEVTQAEEPQLLEAPRRKPLTRQEWIAIFESLGSVALGQTPLSQKKTDVFIATILELKFNLDPKASISRSSISSWVKLNQKKLSAAFDSKTIKARFLKNLEDLKDVRQKSEIIFSMVRIAISGDEYGEIEKSLIQKAILHWDMPAKIFLETEQIHPDVETELKRILADY